MLHELLKQMAADGHSVWVGASEAPDAPDTVIDGVNVVRGFRARRLLHDDWDRVVTHLKESRRVSAWSFSRGIHMTQLVHSDHQWIKQDISAGSDLVVFNTDWVREKLGTHHRGEAVVLHPPVYPEQFRTERGEYVTLVNLIPEKGSNMFYRLANQFPNVKFMGVLGGYEQDRQDLREVRNVTFQEHTANMRDDVYAKTKILLVPSSYESYGMVGLEAAASGIPVMASDTPGLRESLGDAGIFNDVRDAKKWQTRLRYLLQDQNTYDKASEAARKRADQLDTVGEIRKTIDAIESGSFSRG